MELKDDFKGDNHKLIRCIKALLDLDEAGVLVPHGIGGHARSLLTAAASRLSEGASGDGWIVTRGTRSGSDEDGHWQSYDVERKSDGQLRHFMCVRMVARVAGKESDVPHFEAIERRLIG